MLIPWDTTSFYVPPGRVMILLSTMLRPPNVKQIYFLSKVYKRLFATPHQYLVIGGDFNLSFSPALDRHAIGRGRPSPALD